MPWKVATGSQFDFRSHFYSISLWSRYPKKKKEEGFGSPHVPFKSSSLLADFSHLKVGFFSDNSSQIKTHQNASQKTSKRKMKLNIIFVIMALQSAVQASWATQDILTGPLGCGKRFQIRQYRGRLMAIPMDSECQVLPGSHLGRQRIQFRYGRVNRRFIQNWSRFMKFSHNQNKKI